MRLPLRLSSVLPAVSLALAALAATALAENIDPNSDGSQYAWGEAVGWINFEPAGGQGATVSASKVIGYAWGESIGWISLHCDNTASCGTVNYGVTNDGAGNLAGYAWSESKGWISFSCTNTASCGTASFGVTVDFTSGEFEGYAWGESIGWINFNCSNQASCGTLSYKVQTFAVDSDFDGCSDAEEMGPTPSLGGMRNHLFQYDFYDVNGSKKVDAIDVGLVRANFNPSGPLPPEDVVYDRSAGAAAWAPGAPNGVINAVDIGLVRASFNHNCTAAP